MREVREHPVCRQVCEVCTLTRRTLTFQWQAVVSSASCQGTRVSLRTEAEEQPKLTLPRPSLSGWVPGQPADLHHRPPRQPFAWPPGARAHAEPTSGRHCLCPSLGSLPEEWDSWSICISRSKVCQASLCSANRLRVVDGSWLCLPPHHSQPAPCRAWACRVVSSLQAPLLQSQVGEARLPLISPNLPYTVAPSVIFFQWNSTEDKAVSRVLC